MSADDVYGAALFFGGSAAVIYGIGRFLPRLAILCMIVSTLFLFLFVSMAGALSGGSPVFLLVALGPSAGLTLAIRHA